MHMNRLSNKVAVVIGGNSGIGHAIAKRFASEGADVFATGRKALETPALTERSEGAVHPIRADAGSPEDLERVFATVGSQRGRVDVLVRKLGRRVPSSTLPSPTVTARNTAAAMVVKRSGPFFPKTAICNHRFPSGTA